MGDFTAPDAIYHMYAGESIEYTNEWIKYFDISFLHITAKHMVTIFFFKRIVAFETECYDNKLQLNIFLVVEKA